jgi:hypothetical protein
MVLRSIRITLLYSLSTILFYSCQSKPQIPLSDNLKTALGNKYSGYVGMLNKSIKGDTVNMHSFLEIDYIGDGGGYDHGWVLVQLLKKVGDAKFVNVLHSLDKKKLLNVKEYFNVGIDNGGKKNKILFNDYPNTFIYLGFSKAELDMYKN